MFEVIGEVVSLTKAGRNFWASVLFMVKKTPSFNVVEDKQFYHCFGCGRSGDVFKFIEDYRGVAFMDAVQIVADKAGIALQYQARPAQPASVNPNQELYEIHQGSLVNFIRRFWWRLRWGRSATLSAWTWSDGWGDPTFSIGLSTCRRKLSLSKSLWEILWESDYRFGFVYSLRCRNGFDAFQDRIMFPLTDDSGRVIAFSGRLWKMTEDGSHQAQV